jgi:predicted glycosyltransferase
MTARRSLLFYCQHSLGLGHLARSLALCAALAERFRVVLLSGGALPPGISAPGGVEVVPLPPLALAPDRRIVSEDDGYTVEQARTLRLERILATFRATRPEVLVVELFPFGRKKFAEEIVPLLAEAHDRRGGRPLVACSLRDILVSRGERQARHDERAVTLANRYFDVVLVHSDPRFARLEESFKPDTPLRTAVEYTGFVVPARPLPRAPQRRSRVVVSAGGGRVGEPLLRAAVEAHSLLRRHTAMKVIAGPFLPDEHWRSLEQAARGRDGLELVRSVEDLEAELASASASVSQCGYNTALEVMRSGAPALVVPFADDGEDEQTRRAHRLESLGAMRVLDPQELVPDSLAAAIDGLAGFEPRPLALDLDGATGTADALDRLLHARAAA